MEYPPVKRAHIVPATYLENFTIDGKVTACQVVEGIELELAVENVAIRRYAYRRQRPGGSDIDDIEWLLGVAESDATPILRSFSDRWPLTSDDKLKLSVLFAYQMVRGPRWDAEYAEANPEIVSELRRERNVVTIGTREYDVTEEIVDDLAREVATKSYRLLHMVQFAPTLVSLLGTMHWTLVKFASPLIVTSDHPVVPWTGTQALRPQPLPLRRGLLNTIEIRLPLSPRHALLMTWSDKPDDVDATVRGNKDHARRFNAFTIAAADRQWFRQPGAPVLTTTGSLMPLSPELVPRYNVQAAIASQRRAIASEHVNEKIGRDMSDREASIWRVNGPDITKTS